MAEWNKNKVEPSAINSGREFTKNDNLLVNELNAIVNNSFFASEKAQRAEELAESAVEGQGTPVTLNGEVLPTWSADFVEAERQKSKNLFNGIFTQGAYSFGDGSTVVLDSYIRSKDLIDVKPNENIVLSWVGTIPNDECGFIFYNNGRYVGSTRGTNAVVPSNANQVGFNIGQTPTITVDSVSNCQLEYNTIATDYQTYNGAITHNGDASIVFAESERQKSNNLCQLLSINRTYSGLSVSCDDEKQRIKLNGTCTNDADYFANDRNISRRIHNAKGKTVTISNRIVSGSCSSGGIALYIGSQDEDVWSDRFSVLLNGSSTFTIPTDHTYDTLMVFVQNGTICSDLEIEVQIEEGDKATNWQYPYGAIVHEKDIQPDLLYDKETKNSLGGLSYTDGLNGVSEYPLDSNGYKKLKIYAYLTGIALICELDLTEKYGNAYKGGSASLSNDKSDIVMLNYSVGENKDYVAFNLGFWNSNGVTLRNDDPSWFIYRIEGVK